jgi:hypothetical protein
LVYAANDTTSDLAVNGASAVTDATLQTDAFNSLALGRRNTGMFLNGNLQEVVIYETNQSSNRPSIEDNIGGYYDIPLAGLLDENPGAAAAYSLRRLSSTYTGSAVQVQRADNVGGTTDIGFDSYGDLDTAALTTAAAGNSMVVVTWFDQSGNSNDATQGTSTARPKIYDATTGVVLENGKPAVDFASNGANGFNMSSGITGVASVMQVLTPSSTASYRFVLGSGNNYHGGLSGTWIMNPADYTFASPAVYNGDNYLNGTLTNITTTAKVIGTQYLLEMYHDGTTGVSTLSSQLTSSVSRSWGGSMQEVIIYTSNKSTVRTSIEENIGGYYDIPLPGLLDENPGAAAAYSLRRLSSTYTGSTVQVQRADNVGGTHEIGFDSYGDLDTAALTAAAQGNDMVVATWYDQSGNGNDATQGTSSARPKIYDATTGVVLENGKPAVQFDGSNDNIKVQFSSQKSQPNQIVSVLKNDTTSFPTGGFRVLYSGFNSASARHQLEGLQTTGYLNMYAGGSNLSSTVLPTTQSLLNNLVDGVNSEMFLNGVSIAQGDAGNFNTDGFTIGSRFNGLYFFEGVFQELILWNSDQSGTPQAGIETNINTFYNIY